MKGIIKIIVFILFTGCSTSLNFTVKNVQDINVYGSGGFVYSLPHTKLAVTITAIREQTIPGPYQQYADKLLGIDNTSSSLITKWNIINVDIKTLSEPDPEYFFLVESNQSENIIERISKINAAGLILNPDALNSYVQEIPDLTQKSTRFPFSDMLIDKKATNEDEKSKTKKSKDTKDTKYTKEPQSAENVYTSENENSKTFEQKAIEAANCIVKIRKRRFNLISGKKTYYPEGLALETGIQEMDKLELEYLSLFVGIKSCDTLKRTYYYIPKPGNDLERNEICRFSELTGFEDSQSSQGQSMVMELKDMQINGALDHLQLPTPIASSKNTLYYRIPDISSVKVYFGSILLADAELKVFQYGSLVPYSLDCKKK
jgi:Domain of unknown function (DUF4831)